MPVEKISRRIRRKYNKLRKKLRCELATKEDMIKANKWPPGGLRELVQLVNDKKTWFEYVCSTPSRCKQVYQSVCQYLCACLYVGSVQGRKAAVEDLRLQQFPALMRKRSVLSRKFKTRATYGFQPITLCNNSAYVLHKYVTLFRPSGVADDPNDILLVTYTGAVCIMSFYTTTCRLID